MSKNTRIISEKISSFKSNKENKKGLSSGAVGASTAPSSSEKLQKVLARHGFGARREIERWIEQGRLKVNGKLAEIGIRVGTGDRIELDNKLLSININEAFVTRVLLYNKPEGEVSTRKDEQNRPTVFDTLPKVRQGRWVMVGRLDVNTTGLLLFTNDGEFAARLMHPSYALEREYAVRVVGEVAPEVLMRLKQGVSLEDGPARFEEIEWAGGQGLNRWYRVVLKEGRYREVRRLWESQNITVNRLIRLRYGNVVLPRDLRVGKYRELDLALVRSLAEVVNYSLPEEQQGQQSRAKPFQKPKPRAEKIYIAKKTTNTQKKPKA